MARRFAEGARALALDTTPLRVSVPFRALYIGQIVSLLGSQLRLVAVPLQIYAITGSSAAVGLVALVELVPLILFSVVSGAVVDTRDRRSVMYVCQAGLLVTSLGLAVVSLADDPSLGWIYGLAAASSSFNAFDRPARSAMLPELVGLELIPSALALRQVSFQITQLVGPAVGGVLVAFLPHISWIYFLDAVTFVAAIVALHWVPRRKAEHVGSPVSWEVIKEGWRFALRTPLLLSIFVIDLVAMITASPRPLFPALAERVFDAGPAVAGLLYSAPAAGALIGALTTGWVRHVKRGGVAVLVSVAIWGAAIMGAGLTTFSLPLTLVLLAVAGGADVVSAIFRGTMMQEVTPDHLLGRVNAANILVVTGGPRLGDFEAGVVAAFVGVSGSIALGGALCLAGTAAVALAFPSLRSYRRATTEPAA